MRAFVNRFSDWKIGRWGDVCVWVVIPLFLGTAIMLNTIDGITHPYGDGSYPLLANVCGWVIAPGIPLSPVKS